MSIPEIASFGDKKFIVTRRYGDSVDNTVEENSGGP